MFRDIDIKAKPTLSNAVSSSLRRFEHPECNAAPNLPLSPYPNSVPAVVTCELASSDATR